MKKLIQNIRNKPPQVRMTLAVVLALVCTGIIGGLWIGTLMISPQPEPGVTQAPGPWDAFTQSIKSAVKNTDFNGTSEQADVQVIDAGAPSAEYDETNPYGEVNQ